MKIYVDRKKKSQILIAVSVILLLVGVVSLFLILGKDIDQAREQEKVYAQEIIFARGLLEDRSSSRAAVQLIRKKDRKFVMDALTRLAVTSNVRLASLKFSGLVDQKQWPYQRADFDAQLFGSFKDVGLFLTAVRDMPEGIMDINSLRITADSVDPVRVSARITFALFEDKGHGQK